jgi:phosphate transport system permease protein
MMSRSRKNSLAQPNGGSSLVGRRRVHESVIKAVLAAAAALSVITTLGIVVSLLTETISFLRVVPITDFLFGTEWSPSFKDPQYGILPLVAGTLMLALIAVLVAVPLGLGSALYLSEFASPRVRSIFKPILEVLAGVPTIVFGYFALTFFTPTVLNGWLNMDLPVFNALSAGIIMGFMVTPTIASVSEDALSAVPQALREGAYGLGANKMQVAVRVVFPAALSGIVASIVLGVSRAIGETMIVLIAAGQKPNLTADPRQPMETITTFIARTAKGDIAQGSTVYKTIFAVGLTLFLMTFLMNALSIRLVNKYRQVYE